MSRTLIILIAIVLLLTGAIFIVSGTKGTGNPVQDIQSGAITFRDFSPFNPPTPIPPIETPTDNTPVNTDGSTPNTTPDQTYNPPKVRKITNFAVAGFTYFEKERPLPPVVAEEETETPTATPPAPLTEKVTTIRYLQKSNAHIYDLFMDRAESTKLANTTIPKIHEALFSPDGKFVILRYLNDTTGAIQSYSATVPPPSEDEFLGDLKGTFLPENLWQITMSPDGTKIFSLASFDNGVIGDTSGLIGDKKTEIFKSPFTEWLPKWISAKTITLTSKASSNIPGYLYKIDVGTKKFIRVFGNIPGLTTLMSPDEKSVLYASVTGTSITTSLYIVESRESKPIGLNTLPEKCVWAKNGKTIYCAVPVSWPNGTYPDSWYQGTVSLSDSIWEISLAGSVFSLNQLTTSADLSGEEIDAANLKLDATGKYLGFINRKDGTLWSIKL